jgi:copper homeostasis protein (lipoprotein)
MFISDQSYPVLTHGHGSEVSILVRRAGGSGGPASPLGELPATFTGDLPCASCSALHYDLNLFPDQWFILRMTYVGRGAPIDDIGKWAVSPEGSTLVLAHVNGSLERFAVKSGDILRKLDAQGAEIVSQFNYDLRRAASFEPIEPRTTMRGMFRYSADAAVFTECQSGQRWPVAMEGAYKTLEAAYLEQRRQPGEELMASVEGKVTTRPRVDSGLPTATLVVERYIGIAPGETCGEPFSVAPLQETYWKLTAVEGKPVNLAENQREPNLVFRVQDSRVTGFGGCNNLTGGYTLNGNEIAFSRVAATQMACPTGMDIETALLQALDKVRRLKILGQHLELFDAGGRVVARFEARALQ